MCGDANGGAWRCICSQQSEMHLWQRLGGTQQLVNVGPGKAGAGKAGRPSCQATHSDGNPQDKPDHPHSPQQAGRPGDSVPRAPQIPHLAHQLEPLGPGLVYGLGSAHPPAACPFATAQLNPPPSLKNKLAATAPSLAQPSSPTSTPLRLAIANTPRARIPREHPSPGPHCPP